MTTEEMEAFAAKHGLAALLDHLGLDGLGNEVTALVALAQATTEAVFGCESEISGPRLARLTKALRRAEAAGLVYPEAQERGRQAWPY